MNDTSVYSLALSQLSGIGNITFKRLVEHFGSAREVFKAGRKSLGEIEGVFEAKIKAITSFDDWESVREKIKAVEDKRARIISIEDKEYPKRLKNIYDAPSILYIKGSFAEEDELSVAVVGSRRASTYGYLTAENIAAGLAQRGITVVSGMARGIDSKAHTAALNAGGRTIAVLGSGIDVVYPPEGKGLYNEIVERGVVITEFPLGTHPEPGNFPRRNRIISGLSVGVVIIEASETSGALITAELAIDQNREVFAIPGNINSVRSKGTNNLIKKGAKLVESAEEIIDELRFIFGERFRIDAAQQKDWSTSGESFTEEERRVLTCLGLEPAHIDTLIDETGFKSEIVLRILLELEMRGFVKQIPGKNFVLN
ncbi:MAG: DNA-processing protein DprA [Deltaproteobacteria bacterium]|uniref:DNA-processing protein DprA n=1 Tax=Candidatus Zymogenus saltonus TaxID=2844893 RepID=A0A9D8PMT8_9DELT|nr:DNA-processing protein DprA [Candidatus Zymogenus saltonus]